MSFNSPRAPWLPAILYREHSYLGGRCGSRTQTPSIINGIQSPAGQTGGEYWSQKTADRYYDDFTLGLRVSLGTGNTEPMLAPYEDRCIGAGACLSVSMARQGSTRVVALPTSRRVAVYRGAETPPTLLDITSPEFIRTDQILPPNASAETRVRWLSENSTIGMVLPFADRIATFHSQARLEPDWILGQFIDRTVFMNVHAYDGTRLRTDVAVPELPVGNDDTGVFFVDYGAPGRQNGQPVLTLVRIPVL